MNRKLFESIKQGVKASKGDHVFEELTGRTTRSVTIAKDWLQGLKDIVANKADALDVVRETQKKIDDAITSGDTSDIYAHIQQQMPDTTDLGLIAANMQSIEQWINRDSVPPRAMAEGVEEGQVNELVGAAVGALGSAAKAVGGAVKKTVDTGIDTAKSAVAGVTDTVKKAAAPAQVAENYSVVNATTNPDKVNSYADAPEIVKTDVDYTDDDALDVTNKNSKGTVGDEVQEEVEDIESAGDTGDGMSDDGEDANEDMVEAWEIFCDEDGDLVYFNEEGELFYATAQDCYEAGIDEDVIINMYGSEQGGGEEIPAPAPEPASEPAPPVAPPAEGGVQAGPPQEPAPQSPGQMGAGGQSPQGGEEQLPPPSPMDVELVNNGATGEVDKVIVNVGGKRIEIGPDGNVIEQPVQVVEEYEMGDSPLRSLSRNVLGFFLEHADDYKDVAKRTPKTATGGQFPDGIGNVDPEALDSMNRGRPIDGSKTLKEEETLVEAFELFEDADGDLVFFDEDGTLFYASEEQIAALDESDYDYITLGRGLGKSIRVPKGRTDTATFEEIEPTRAGSIARRSLRKTPSPETKAKVDRVMAAYADRESKRGINDDTFSKFLKGFERGGKVAESADMVDTGSTGKGVSEPETPNGYYERARKDFNGKKTMVQDRESKRYVAETLRNSTTFKYLSRGINEDWRDNVDEGMFMQVMQDMETQDGLSEGKRYSERDRHGRDKVAELRAKAAKREFQLKKKAQANC